MKDDIRFGMGEIPETMEKSERAFWLTFDPTTIRSGRPNKNGRVAGPDLYHVDISPEIPDELKMIGKSHADDFHKYLEEIENRQSPIVNVYIQRYNRHLVTKLVLPIALNQNGELNLKDGRLNEINKRAREFGTSKMKHYRIEVPNSDTNQFDILEKAFRNGGGALVTLIEHKSRESPDYPKTAIIGTIISVEPNRRQKIQKIEEMSNESINELKENKNKLIKAYERYFDPSTTEQDKEMNHNFIKLLEKKIEDETTHKQSIPTPIIPKPIKNPKELSIKINSSNSLQPDPLSNIQTHNQLEHPSYDPLLVVTKILLATGNYPDIKWDGNNGTLVEVLIPGSKVVALFTNRYYDGHYHHPSDKSIIQELKLGENIAMDKGYDIDRAVKLANQVIDGYKLNHPLFDSKEIKEYKNMKYINALKQDQSIISTTSSQLNEKDGPICYSDGTSPSKEPLCSYVKYLVDNGLISENDCPIISGPKMYIVNTVPKHRDGSNFHDAFHYKWIWVETHGSTHQNLNNLNKLKNIFEQPSQILKTKTQDKGDPIPFNFKNELGKDRGEHTPYKNETLAFLLPLPEIEVKFDRTEICTKNLDNFCPYPLNTKQAKTWIERAACRYTRFLGHIGILEQVNGGCWIRKVSNEDALKILKNKFPMIEW
jgi:hypothetical protein